MRGFWLVLCALGCNRTSATRPPDPDPENAPTAAAEPSVTPPTTPPPITTPTPTTPPPEAAFPVCTESTSHGVGLGGLGPDELRARYGPPARQETFRVEERQGEFYAPIANTYPTTDPKNRGVLLEEWTWTSGDCVLSVWLHRPKDDWRVLDDFFWHKDAAF